MNFQASTLKHSSRAVRITVLFIVLLGLVFAWVFVLPDYLRKRIETTVHENCKTCELRIGKLDLSFFSLLGFSLHDVHFKGGQDRELGVHFTVEEVRGKIEPWSLFEKQIVLSDLVIERYKVLLINGDYHRPPTHEHEEPSPYEFVVNGADAKHGVFVYTRNTHGTSATLHIHDITLHAEKFGDTAPLRAAKLAVEAHMQIEKSGDILLNVETSPFLKPLKVAVALAVRDQNLEDVTPFFKANAGVNLKGVLVKGLGSVSMVDKHLKASVDASYKDFALKLDRAHDRSEIAAFFTSLGATIIMNGENFDKPHEQRIREVDADRKPGESIVSFILRGLKEAAIKVAEAHGG